MLAPDGRRIQVKALWRRGSRRSTLSALRGLEQRGFDVLLAVVFAADLRSWDGYELDYDLVVEKAGWSKTWSAHRLSLSQTLLLDARVRHVVLEVPPNQPL